MEASPHRAQQARLVELVKAWNSRGVALPVAVAVSILDDLLAQPETTSRRPRLDDVVIDHRGVAMLDSEHPGNLDDIAPLVAEMLGDGSDRDAVPANARSLLARLTSDDPTERPRDADQLRTWIRETLGAPAAREEVIACLGATNIDESLLPPPSLVEHLPEPDPVDDEDENLPTLPPEPSNLDEILPPPELDETEVVEPDPPRRSTIDLVHEATISVGHPPPSDGKYEEDHLASETLSKSYPPTPVERLMARVQSIEEGQPTMPPVDPNRPVVRVQPAGGPRTAVQSAPAARRSPRPLTAAGDSLILPAERRGNWGVWLMVFAVVVAAIYYYLF
jgi:hypothetical protein